METEFLNWLVADVPVFGFKTQNWMLALIGLSLFYLCVTLALRGNDKGPRSPSRGES